MDIKPIGSENNPEDAAPMSPIEVFEPLCAVFRRHLKSLGQKYTPERAQVLDVLLQLDEPFQADYLLEEVSKTGTRVSKATIYRTIKLLQEAGIIQQVLIESEHAHYVLAYGSTSKDLLVRTDTNEVEVISVPELEELCAKVAALRGLKVKSYRLQVYAEAQETK